MNGERITQLEENARPRGVHFPFTRRMDGIPSADIPPDIYVSNVKQILLTTPGERVMRPTFGTNLKTLLFSPIPSPFMEENIKAEVRRAINTWEPRVAIFGISVETRETEILIEVNLVSPLGARKAGIKLRTSGNGS